ncbi:MAG: 2OG-Fe(II) oxygenase [Campylobacterales bacterium]|nr:2OG-Fe(II) oxygenase [Campylobacterales bacterium]
MHQISNYIYADDLLLGMGIPSKRLPNPYFDLPYIIIKNFLTPDECHAIAMDTLADKEAVKAQLRGRALDTAIRKTDIHTLNAQHLTLYESRFTHIRPEIEQFFSLSLSHSTQVQVLGYEKGGFYLKHSDDSSELRDSEGVTVGFKVVARERKLTTVLFTTSYSPHSSDTDHFSGGELLFNYLCDVDGNTITLRPKTGDMVVFLSNPYFSHEVLPVQSGFRLTLVQWHNAHI